MLDATTAWELTQLYARYAAVLDAADWDAWPGFFTEACLYQVIPRENHERGFPLATLSFESTGMMKDRVYGIRETLFHDPYYQRHVIGAPLVQRVEHTLDATGQPATRIHAQANYAVFRTKLSEPTQVFNVGRYLDEIVRTPEGLRFAVKRVVYDSELIPNSLIYPI